jgi:hypothetical protein
MKIFYVLVFAGIVVSSACTRNSDSSPQSGLPSTETMMSWISDIEEQGYRRPGWPADEWTEKWAVDMFEALGLEDITLDPIEVTRWEEREWSLTVWPKGQPDNVIKLASWPIPLSKPVEELTAELVLSPSPADVRAGTIAVVEYPLMEMPQAHIRDDVATWSYDPDGEFNTLSQVLPMGERFQKIMDPEADAGAAAYIGILNFPWQTDKYYVPYDSKPRDIPGLYLSRNEGRRLLDMMADGPVIARLSVDAGLTRTVNHNVYATLPGRSDEWLVIGSHHDGPWNSAVEDASGVAMVMAQAQYWSRLPAKERPHNMLFLLTGGHMSGGAGLHDFAEKHKDFLTNDVVAEIHLEHIALVAKVVDGQLVPTDKPEVRWWFTSYIPRLERIVGRAICREDLTRSLMMPSTGWPRPDAKRPPTDASVFFFTTPVVSLLAAPMYLFDPADRMNMVDEKSLLPVSRAVIDIVQELGSETAKSLRAGQYAPPRSERLNSDCNELNNLPN